MRKRTAKIISMILAASMVFSMNTVVFGEEIHDSAAEETVVTEQAIDNFEEIEEVTEYSETDGKGAAAIDDDTKNPVRELLSGNVVMTVSDDKMEDLKVLSDNTLSESVIRTAVLEHANFENNGKTYRLITDNESGTGKWALTDGKQTSDNISSNIIVTYAVKDYGKTSTKPVEVKNGVLSGVTGNQTVVFTLKLANLDNQKNITFTPADGVTGEVFVHEANAGDVITRRLEIGTIDGAKTFMEVEYDGACEYRGSKVTASTHRINEDDPDGVIDGAIGISVKFSKLSSNGIYYPVKGDSYGDYYWKDQNGITIKKAVIKNGKAVASASADKAPYFTLSVTFKNTDDGVINKSERNALRKLLKTTKFYFTIEPKKISTDLFTTDKKKANAYFISKLSASSDGKKLKANIAWQNWKLTKGAFNVRTMKRGKALKLAKRVDSDNFKTDSKGQIVGDLLWSVNSDGSVNFTGNASYRGVAKNIKK